MVVSSILITCSIFITFPCLLITKQTGVFLYLKNEVRIFYRVRNNGCQAAAFVSTRFLGFARNDKVWVKKA